MIGCKCHICCFCDHHESFWCDVSILQLELVNDFVIEDKPDDGLDIDITNGEGNLATGWC